MDILVLLFWVFIGVPVILAVILGAMASGGGFATVLMVVFSVYLYQVLGGWSIPVIIFLVAVWHNGITSD
jgi:hypothetical protein